jgi:hypothetical protein
LKKINTGEEKKDDIVEVDQPTANLMSTTKDDLEALARLYDQAEILASEPNVQLSIYFVEQDQE